MGKNKSLKKLNPKSGTRFCPSDVEPPPNYDSFQPVFSFRYMNYGSGFCLSKCNQQSKSSVSDTLLKLSQLTWSKINSRPKESLGFEKIPSDQFKASLPSVITPEVSVLVFRFSKSGRMAGFREKDIYHIILVSPNHDLY